MTIQQRIQAFHRLGIHLQDISNPALLRVVEEAGLRNPWFTPENVHRSLRALSSLLHDDALEKWLAPYPFDPDLSKEVGLVFAGNIPLVGFHDLLAVLCAGYKAQIKLSSQDQVLNRYLISRLTEIEPGFSERIHIVERLQRFDIVIATGSDNSARYFDHYFGKFPHVIRRNRNGVAILDGSETPAGLAALGEDIFSYYGLGCRNVAKLFLPKGYDVARFFEGIAAYEPVREHYKYTNNYDFHKSIYLINGDPHFDNGFLLLRPEKSLSSPLAVVHFEEYESHEQLQGMLSQVSAGIQCMVGDQEKLNGLAGVIPFGRSQYPGLEDYADGVNTLDFLADQTS